MSAVSHPAAAFPGRTVARLRSIRVDLDFSRGKRLRLYLLGTVALIATLVVIPLLLVFKQASDRGGEGHTPVVE